MQTVAGLYEGKQLESFNPLPDRERVFESLPKPGEAMRARYISGLYPLAKMGPLLRRQAHQVGLDDADTWVAIADGATGLEDFLKENFPRVEAVILDFYHAAEYLAKLAQALTPDDEEAARRGRRGHDRGAGGVGLADATYEANGWYIGSGAVESACKTVVGQRLKGPGMRWSEPGGHARALYRSELGQWGRFLVPRPRRLKQISTNKSDAYRRPRGERSSGCCPLNTTCYGRKHAPAGCTREAMGHE